MSYNLYTNDNNLYGVTIATDGTDVDFVDPTEGPTEIPDITGHANEFLKVNSSATNIEWGSLTGAGGLNINQVNLGDGTQAQPSLCFQSDTNTGIFRKSADTLAITTGGVEKVDINTLDTNFKHIVSQTIPNGESGFFEISKNVENVQSNPNIVKDWFANINSAQDTFNEGQSWFDVIYNNVLKLYVAISRESFNVANRTLTNKIATSPDGYTWTLRTTPVVPPNTPPPSTLQVRWDKIDYNRTTGRTWVCSGDPTPNGLMYSDDGITWTAIVEPSNVNWSVVKYFTHINTWFIGGANRIGYSTDDGNNWTVLTTTYTTTDICYNSKTGFFYAGGGTSFRRTATPLDVNSWVETSASVIGTNFITYSPDLNAVVCSGVGSNNNLSISYDNGSTFTTITISADNYSERRFCIWCPKYKCFILSCCNVNFSLGNYGTPDGKIFYSFNGTTWINANLPAAFFYWAIHYIQEKDTLIITTLNNGNTANKFYITNPNKLQPTADNLYNGIHQTMDNTGNWTFKKNVGITGNLSVSGNINSALNITGGNATIGTTGTNRNLLVNGNLEYTGTLTGTIPTNIGNPCYSSAELGVGVNSINADINVPRYIAALCNKTLPAGQENVLTLKNLGANGLGKTFYWFRMTADVFNAMKIHNDSGSDCQVQYWDPTFDEEKSEILPQGFGIITHPAQTNNTFSWWMGIYIAAAGNRWFLKQLGSCWE